MEPMEVTDVDITFGLVELTGISAETAVMLYEIAEEIGRREKEVNELRASVDVLKKENRCCGVVHWRDAEIMYLNHGHGVDCPYCGVRNGRQRIRRYVGVDCHAQEEAGEAIDNWKMWVDVASECDRKRHELEGVYSRLSVVLAKQRRLL